MHQMRSCASKKVAQQMYRSRNLCICIIYEAGRRERAASGWVTRPIFLGVCDDPFSAERACMQLRTDRAAKTAHSLSFILLRKLNLSLKENDHSSAAPHLEEHIQILARSQSISAPSRIMYAKTLSGSTQEGIISRSERPLEWRERERGSNIVCGGKLAQGMQLRANLFTRADGRGRRMLALIKW